jgi:hypothetical protein
VSAATAPRQTLGPPADIPVVNLSIRAQGERIALDLDAPGPDRLHRSRWSGGCQWPEWPKLKHWFMNACATSGGELSGANAIGALLQRVVPDELLRGLDRVPSGTTVALSLSPETEMLPWEWLIVEGSPLCLRNAVIRRPVGISDKARGLRFVGRPLRALLVGDAGIGDGGRSGAAALLPGAASETRGLKRLLQGADSRNVVKVLEREEAVYRQLVAEVESGDYDIIHFAGHAWFEQSEALLYLWDGRVSSSELSSLLNRRPPALLVLNSHYTAFVPLGLAVDESPRGRVEAPPGVDRPTRAALGFTSLASRSGVGAFVGSFAGALKDDRAAQFALVLYERLLGGTPFAAALHEARKETTRVDDITGLFYTGTGYAGLVLSRPR